MKAEVVMYVDGDWYPYGTYPYDTEEEKGKVRDIAAHVGNERDAPTDIRVLS